MLKLLAFLWSGCWHKWREVKRVRLQCWDEEVGKGEPQTGDRVFVVCERCGVQKKWDLA